MKFSEFKAWLEGFQTAMPDCQQSKEQWEIILDEIHQVRPDVEFKEFYNASALGDGAIGRFFNEGKGL